MAVGKKSVAIQTNPENNTNIKKRKTKVGIQAIMFRSTVKKIIKVVYVDSMQVSSSTIEVMSAIFMEILDSISDIAVELSRKAGKQTIGAEEITAAFQIYLSGELAQQTLNEIRETLAKQQSKGSK